MQCLHECNALFELNYILSHARGIRHAINLHMGVEKTAHCEEARSLRE